LNIYRQASVSIEKVLEIIQNDKRTSTTIKEIVAFAEKRTKKLVVTSCSIRMEVQPIGANIMIFVPNEANAKLKVDAIEMYKEMCRFALNGPVRQDSATADLGLTR
jgi:2-hydroxy-3-keto-5-methylthiopentenyl-1-phosphate phosphatase